MMRLQELEGLREYFKREKQTRWLCLCERNESRAYNWRIDIVLFL